MFGEALDDLEAALDVLQDEDLDDVGDARLQGEIDRLQRLRTRLEAESLRRAGAWQRRGLWAESGARSARAELGRRWQIGVGAAGSRLDVAARLVDAPVTGKAFAAGELSFDKARLLCTAVGGDVPEATKAAFARCEPSMVEAARLNTYAKVRELMAFWFAYTDPDGLRRAYRSKYERRGLSASTTLDGMVAIDGLLDPETGQLVLEALEHLADQLWRDEHRATKGTDGRDGCGEPVGRTRTSRQQRADALGEMARIALGYQRSRDRFDGRHRPRVTAVADVGTLAARLIERGRRLEQRADRQHADDLADREGSGSDGPRLVDHHYGTGDHQPISWSPGQGGVAMLADLRVPIPAEAAQRLACDAGLDSIITTTDFVPLAATSVQGEIPAAVRRAVVQRDGCCSFPGCELPPRCCDVHHIHERHRGGGHSVTNCALLCKRHHRLVHEGDWQIAIDPHTRRPAFRDPDGHLHHADPSPRQLADLAIRSGRPPDGRGSDDDPADRLPLVS